MDRMNMPSPTLPPGFRFHPTDQELIFYYLRKKVSSSSNPEVSLIADVNIYKYNPWDLPGKAFFGENEWFFFSPRDRKYPNGARPNRAAPSGYWKATGTDKPILTSNGSQCLGVKKALVFYKGRPPKGIKTNWMMLEYRLLDDAHQLHRLRGSMRLDDSVLCRVRQKNNNSRQREDTYDSSCGNSSFPFIPGCLQGQEITNNYRNYTFNHDFQDCLTASLESEEAEEHGQIDFQGGSPGYSTSTADHHSQSPMVSSFKEAIESIKKVLSIGALEDQVPASQIKKLHVSISNNPENASIFQVSSPTEATYLQSFSGFMI